MTSIWMEADHRAREAIAAELRSRGTLTQQSLTDAWGRVGSAVSIKALRAWNDAPALTAFVRTALPA